MKIRNLETLATTPIRRVALEIAEKGLEAIDTALVLEKSLSIGKHSITVCGKEYPLSPNGKLITICIGKCAAEAAFAFEKILGSRISFGVALGVGEVGHLQNQPLKKIKYYAGTHPMPSEANIIGTKALLDSLTKLSAEDTVLFLISGGGSTLLAQPACVPGDIRELLKLLEEEKVMIADLFKTGATIQEINTVRKHMSLARGGFLAEKAYPAQIISIIFSDVPRNDIGFVSSGPTVKDTSLISDAEAVIKKYKLKISSECLTETPKDDSFFAKVYNILAVSNESALFQMKKAGEELGFAVEIKNKSLTGEARDVAKALAKEINSAQAGTIFLYSGETTVTVRTPGRGGRNQELALAALPHLEENRIVLSLASDGHDNGPHAGALADMELAKMAKEKGVNPHDSLKNNDSSNFFETVGGLIETGDTGSNVSDLMIAISGKL